VVTAKQVVRVAEHPGFVFRRQRGSHAIYVRQSDRARVVIPMHRDDLKRKTLRSIVRDLKITLEEFRKMLGASPPTAPANRPRSISVNLHRPGIRRCPVLQTPARESRMRLPVPSPPNSFSLLKLPCCYNEPFGIGLRAPP